MAPSRITSSVFGVLICASVWLSGCGGGGGGGTVTPPVTTNPTTPTNPTVPNAPTAPGNPAPVDPTTPSNPTNPGTPTGPVVQVPAPGPSPAPPSVPRGAARLSVDWGGPNVPSAAQSVRLSLILNGQVIGEALLTRPADGLSPSVATFTDLSPADIAVRAVAFPSRDGSGVAQASALLTITVAPGQTAEATLRLNSLVKTVRVTPADLALSRGQTAQLVASALDADNNVVLVDPATWNWTIDNGGAATLATDGDRATLTSSGVGAGRVTVRDNNSGAVAQVGLENVLYRNLFDNGAGPEWSSNRTDMTPVGARKFLGRFGKETVTMALDNLPPHGRVTLTFDLYLCQSWDGNQVLGTDKELTLGPDRFTLAVENGPTLLDTTFSNNTPAQQTSFGFPGGFPQSYPGAYLAANNPPQTGTTEASKLGYSWLNSESDSVYRLSYTFEHGGSSLRLNFVSGQNQGTDDESWGLDNVQVQVLP